MRRSSILATIGVILSALPLPDVSAEELRGAARREYERVTSEGSLFTSCSANSGYFVFWAGKQPSVLDFEGKSRPIQFEHHKVGDYVRQSYQCHTAEGLLTMTTRLTHSISNSQCGAGNDFIAKVSVSHLGSYSDDFLVDGCGGTSGLLLRGKHVLLCRMPDDDKAVAGHCAEGTDAMGPRELH